MVDGFACVAILGVSFRKQLMCEPLFFSEFVLFVLVFFVAIAVPSLVVLLANVQELI